MIVHLTREQAELLTDALEQAEQGMNFGGLRNRFRPSCIAPMKKKLTEALQIDARRTTDGSMRIRVGERIFGVQQARILRYVEIYPQLACAPLIAHALSLHPTHVFMILRNLQEKGLVQERKRAEWMTVGRGRPRKFYELTREGRAAVARMRYLDAVGGRKIPAVPLPHERANGFSPGVSQSGGNWVEWMQANA